MEHGSCIQDTASVESTLRQQDIIKPATILVRIDQSKYSVCRSFCARWLCVLFTSQYLLWRREHLSSTWNIIREYLWSWDMLNIMMWQQQGPQMYPTAPSTGAYNMPRVQVRGAQVRTRPNPSSEIVFSFNSSSSECVVLLGLQSCTVRNVISV